MSHSVSVSGIGTATHGGAVEAALLSQRPGAVGIASAFVSIGGMQRLISQMRRCGDPDCRLIAGIDNAVTHPEALVAAKAAGWQVRIGRSAKGIFHPKLIVAGRQFNSAGKIKGLSYVYVGSSNVTIGGQYRNVECGFSDDGDNCVASAADVFGLLWTSSVPASEAEIRHYSARFAELSRRRRPSELIDLGVSDSGDLPTDATSLGRRSPPERAAVGTEFAVAAWTGLQSFTGEYRFQVEFPRLAGRVIRRLIRNRAQRDGRTDVYCADGVTRVMQYRFYPDNGMFRLNIPNDVPGVDWARQHRAGLALVEQGPHGGSALRLTLLRPGEDANDIIARSAALQTWGRTPTRAYGWF